MNRFAPPLDFQFHGKLNHPFPRLRRDCQGLAHSDRRRFQTVKVEIQAARLLQCRVFQVQCSKLFRKRTPISFGLQVGCLQPIACLQESLLCSRLETLVIATQIILVAHPAEAVPDVGIRL